MLCSLYSPQQSGILLSYSGADAVDSQQSFCLFSVSLQQSGLSSELPQATNESVVKTAKSPIIHFFKIDTSCLRENKHKNTEAHIGGFRENCYRSIHRRWRCSLHLKRTTSNDTAISRPHHTHTHVIFVFYSSHGKWPPFLLMAILYIKIRHSSNII